MNNPFDTADGRFTVLVNGEGQHSLWPSFLDAPAGWTVALPESDRDACMAYIESHWDDMRPRSLATADSGS
ncbi:MbtH family protein [Streptomyces sp. URMC 123]|uniref:MbtH family protein n=1 Tax=Streptomyces sp. URMC 123 TaxID=3423403 RepID=UPI003F197B48